MKKEKEIEMELTKENKMGTMKIPKLLFSISVPIIISMLVQALYNIVDSIFVAKFDNIAGTGALTLAFPIQMLMIAVATGFGIGMNALLSRSLGEKNKEKVDLVAGQGILLTIGGFLLFFIFGLFLTKSFVGLSESEGTLLYEYSVDYITICTVASLGIFVQVTMERLLQATGKSIYSMITQLSGAVTNLILDPILIFGYLGAPAMGVRGAALATVIGQFVSAIVGIVLNITLNHEISLKIKNFIPDLKVLIEMLIIAIPAVVMQAIGSVMTFTMNNILLKFSNEALNVFGIYFKLQSFIFMPVFGLNNGMVPIIAYNYGARKPSRVYATMKLSAIAAVAYMLVGFAAFQILPEALLGLFNASAEMLSIGVTALRIISISFMMAGFSIVSISTCQALGKSIYSLVVSVIRQIVVLIPSAYLLSLFGNVDLVWWSFPIAEVVGVTSCIIFVKIVLKQSFSGVVEAEETWS